MQKPIQQFLVTRGTSPHFELHLSLVGHKKFIW